MDSLSRVSRRNVIRSTRTEVDANRIGLWGDSYTGGQVVVVAACEERPKVVVEQCPVLGPTVPGIEPSPDTLAMIQQVLLWGDVAGAAESTTGPPPVVSSDQQGTPSRLAPIQAFRWFIEYAGSPGSGWVHRVTRVLLPTPVGYSPYLCAPFVPAKTPMVVAPEHQIVRANCGVTRKAFEPMPGFKGWYDTADGHSGLLYYPGLRFDVAISVQADCLRANLGA